MGRRAHPDRAKQGRRLARSRLARLVLADGCHQAKGGTVRAVGRWRGGGGRGLLPLLPRGWCRRCPLHQGGQREEGTSFPVMSDDLVPEASQFLVSRGQSGDGTHRMWPVSLGVPRDGGTAGPQNHSPMPPSQLPRIPKRAPLLSPLAPSRNTCPTLV